MNELAPPPRVYFEGDLCMECGHWFWNDGHWHSLVPITYADNITLARLTLCPTHAHLATRDEVEG